MADAPVKKTNRLGLTLDDYKGGKSTLCAGCGHDAITNQIIKAFFDAGIEAHKVAKLSGIGCSSKTPAYFLNRAHGFNSVHGRMPAVATGALLANRELIGIGVSGDGDTASIGLGQFMHLLRRNLPMVYLCENNGVYGLTKGQFSATADMGSKLKSGVINEMPPIDLCTMAIEMGCSFVARSFAGDPKQLQTLLRAALSHNGTAFIDIISPCVTFNNHEGSTKSYPYAKEKEEQLHELGYVPYYEEIQADVTPGTAQEIRMHDGSQVTIKKLAEDFDPTNKAQALQLLAMEKAQGRFLTGLMYIDETAPSLVDQLQLVDEPLVALPETRIRPSRETLDKILGDYL
ncbi:2-oxoglutarate oxidoreductase subunit KorB [compost metagenome]